jgi:hypothetical protein
VLYLGAIAGLNAALAACLWPVAGRGRKAALWLALAWLAALGAAGLGLRSAVWTATGSFVIALGALALSPGWRAAVREMPGCRMISANLLRVPYGITLLMMGSRDVLPEGVAESAGMGAIVVGILAPLAVWAIQENLRGLVVVWNLLSILDLANSIRLAAGNASLAEPGIAAMVAFAVPVLLIVHLYLFWKLSAWSRMGLCDSSALWFNRPAVSQR